MKHNFKISIIACLILFSGFSITAQRHYPKIENTFNTETNNNLEPNSASNDKIRIAPHIFQEAFGHDLLADVTEKQRVISDESEHKEHADSTETEEDKEENLKPFLKAFIILSIPISAILFFVISHDELKTARSGRIGANVVARKTSIYIIILIAILLPAGLMFLPFFLLFKLIMRKQLTINVSCPSCGAVGAFKNIRKEFHVEFEKITGKTMRTQHWCFVCKQCGTRLKETLEDDVTELAKILEEL